MFYNEDEIQDMIDDERDWQEWNRKVTILPKRKRKPRNWTKKALYIVLWFLLSIFLCNQLAIGIMPRYVTGQIQPPPIIILIESLLLIGITLYLIIKLFED